MNYERANAVCAVEQIMEEKEVKISEKLKEASMTFAEASRILGSIFELVGIDGDVGVPKEPSNLTENADLLLYQARSIANRISQLCNRL